MKNFFLTAIIFFGSYAMAQIPTGGLVGAWPFSGNALDISGSNNHGTVSGPQLTADRCGNLNSAYLFDGINDDIVMQKAGPQGAAARTVLFWAKTSSINLMAAVGWGRLAFGESFAHQYNYNCIGVGTDVNNQAFTMGSSCVTNDVWHHVAAIFNPSVSPSFGDMEYYVNGVKLPGISCVISGSTQAVNTGSQFPVTVGRVHDDFARYFNGSIDDIYIYNRVLSTAEILQIYRTPCSLPAITICRGSVNIFSIAPVFGATSYSWSVPAGWSGSSSTNTISTSLSNSSGTVIATATGTCGMISRCATNVILKECEVGISEDENNFSSASVFPNPGSGQFIVTAVPGSVFSICNSLGSVICRVTADRLENKVDLTRYASGIYFFRISSPTFEKVIKVMKE